MLRHRETVAISVRVLMYLVVDIDILISSCICFSSWDTNRHMMKPVGYLKKSSKQAAFSEPEADISWQAKRVGFSMGFQEGKPDKMVLRVLKMIENDWKWLKCQKCKDLQIIFSKSCIFSDHLLSYPFSKHHVVVFSKRGTLAVGEITLMVAARGSSCCRARSPGTEKSIWKVP